jgi:hypothetical protein
MHKINLGGLVGRVFKKYTGWRNASSVMRSRIKEESKVHHCQLYAPDMKPFLTKENIANFNAALRKVNNRQGAKIEIGNIKLERMKKSVIGSGGNTGTGYYVLTIGGKRYFVKEFVQGKTGVHFNAEFDTPLRQANALFLAKKLQKEGLVIEGNGWEKKLSDFDFATPKVVFASGKRMFLVTDYVQGELVEDAVTKSRHKYTPSELRKLDFITYQMEESDTSLLGNALWSQTGLSDFNAHNTIYNPKTKRVTVIELSLDRNRVRTLTELKKMKNK